MALPSVRMVMFGSPNVGGKVARFTPGGHVAADRVGDYNTMSESPAQVPGYYRHKVGDVTITALNDGFLAAGAGVLSGMDGDAAGAVLSAAFLPPTPVITVNAYLVQTQGMTVLIDAGSGSGMGPTAGKLAANLAHAGVGVGDVDLILLTHMHPDHIGGLLHGDADPSFPRARILVPGSDAAVFLDADLAERVADDAKPAFATARAVAAAYAGRFDRFDGESELAPGIRPVALPGHSPGHTGFRITNAGQTLLIWGDVVHVPGIQFGHPDVGMVFDADPALAQRTRRDIFATVAGSREMVAGMHMPFPGFGHVATDGTAYRFIPILWNPGLESLAGGV